MIEQGQKLAMTIKVLNHLVAVVTTPAATLLLVVVVVVSVVAATESLLAIASILAARVTLLTGLSTTDSAVLAAGLAAMERMLLCEVAWVSTIALLGRLWWGKDGLTRSCVRGRAGTAGLGNRWAGTVGRLVVTEWLQVIGRSSLSTLLTVVLTLALVGGVAAEDIVGAAESAGASSGLLRLRRLSRTNTTVIAETRAWGVITVVD